MFGHTPSGFRKATSPSDLAPDPPIKQVLMAGAQEPLEPQLALLRQNNQLLTAQIEALTAHSERLSREVQQLTRQNEQLLAAVRSAGMAAQRNADANSAAAAANFPWYLPVMQMGCHEQAAFTHRTFGV